MVLALLLILFRDWSLYHTTNGRVSLTSLYHQEFFSLGLFFPLFCVCHFSSSNKSPLCLSTFPEEKKNPN